MSKQTIDKQGNKMVISRTFDAPANLVFEVHSSCKHLLNWYGGSEWPLVKCNMDFRVGGKWSYCFEIAGEGQTCGLAVYKEIRKPEIIVYKDHFLDENGNISQELPPSIITYEFSEVNGKTTIINTWEYPTDSDLDNMIEMGAIEGLTDIWNSLESYLKKNNRKQKNS